MSSQGPPVDELVDRCSAPRGAATRRSARPRRDGVLVLLAIDKPRPRAGAPLRHRRRVRRAPGLPEEELRHIWRSLGFPDPTPGEAVFSDVDLGNLAAVADLMHSGVVSPEVTYGMTRVDRLVDGPDRVGADRRRERSPERRRPGDVEDDDGGPRADRQPRRAASCRSFPAVLEQVWRRHLQAAARRRLLRGDTEDGHGLVVGFADLVGFTALAQQVSDEELAEVVDQFEHLAYDVVVAGGGRVVKMIGDEVMFIVEDPLLRGRDRAWARGRVARRRRALRRAGRAWRSAPWSSGRAMPSV